jgi:hypothetical protein
VARLSLWKDGKHTNDYKFFDRRISEMFTIGGTGVLLNKYLGPTTQGVQLTTSASQVNSTDPLIFPNTNGVQLNDFVFGAGIPANTQVASINTTAITLSATTTSLVGTGATIGFSSDATQPSFTNQSELNIQDLLWTENRDRKYDTSVYKMRGIYQRADQDFDLSQFGLFLQTGTIFMVFHLRDMVDMIGRKLLSGDVLELEHLKDYDSLNQDVPAALKRFYVVGDASFASEGFSPTWWPHLWRVKLNPLVDSQEYKDILNNLAAGPDTTTPVGQILSTYNTYLNMNQAIVAQAEFDVPESGYDTSSFYTMANVGGIAVGGNAVTGDSTTITADNNYLTSDSGIPSPDYKIQGYLTGDGKAPNSLITGAGVAFPSNPKNGDYFLRLDYLPNRLFRFNGNYWSKIEDAVRTNLTPGATNNNTQLSGYVNNTNTFVDSNNNTQNSLQPLSRVLGIRADNNES